MLAGIAMRKRGMDPDYVSPLVTGRIRRVCTHFLLVLAAGVGSLAPGAASAADLPHQHLAVFAGLGTESKPGHEDANGFAVGIEYEFRFHEKWGVGAVVEGLGQDTIRNALVVLPVSFHPGGHWRIIAGPGMEFTPKKDKFAVRLGVGYEIPLAGHWSLSPEVFLDLFETGENTWVGGLALGYGF